MQNRWARGLFLNSQPDTSIEKDAMNATHAATVAASVPTPVDHVLPGKGQAGLGERLLQFGTARVWGRTC